MQIPNIETYIEQIKTETERAKAPITKASILDDLNAMRAARERYWLRNEEPPDPYPQIKEIFRQTGHLDRDAIDEAIESVEKKPAPLATKCRAELRKIWQGARKFAQADGVLVVRPDRPKTYPYDVKDGRIVYLSERMVYDVITVNTQVVADFAAMITSEITDENGARTFVIKGNAIRGGPFEVEMDAQDFGNDRRLKGVLDAASGARDPVRARMGGHLSAALQLLTQDDVAMFQRFKRTGWANGRFLIPGRETPGIMIEPGDKPPYKINKDADLRTGLETLDNLLSCAITPERATVPASLVFQAPLARLAGWENERYCVFVTGRTGSLKTTFLQALLCIYGPGFTDDDKLTKWGDGATANALMGMSTRANDLPFFIDNFKPGTGGGVRAFIGLIHNMMEGGEKDRLNRNAELRKTKPVFCWPVCTGEDVPDTDPASLARILVVQFLWQDAEEYPKLSQAQQYTEHLCAVGESWLAWLESDAGKQAGAACRDAMPETRREWVRRLGHLNPDSVNKMRVASNLATNQLTWVAMCKHPEIGEIARKYQQAHLDGLNLVAEAMAEATAEALEASRYIAAIRELVLTGQALLPDPNQEFVQGDKEKVIGYSNGMGVYLLPALSRQAAERLLGERLNGISQNALNKQFDTLKLIESHNKGTLLKSKRFSGEAVRVLHLSPDVLQIEDANEDEIPF